MGCRHVAPLPTAALALPADPFAPGADETLLECRAPASGGGTLRLQLPGRPFAGWPNLCRQLAALAWVPKNVAAEHVRASQHALQGLGTFAQVRCSTTATPATMLCALAPAAMVQSFHFAGHVPFAVPGDELRRRIALRPGTVLTDDAAQLAAQARRLENYLRQEGYFDAAVAITPHPVRGAQPHRGVALAIAVTARQTATVRRVEVEGEVALPTDALAKRFLHRTLHFYAGRFRPGQLADDAEEAAETLRDAGYVGARVTASYRHDADARAVDVTVKVRAGPRVRLRLEGTRWLSQRTLHKLAPFAESGAVDAVAAEQLRLAVLRQVQEDGYAQAEVHASIGRGIEAHTRVVTITLGPAGIPKTTLQTLRVVGAQRLSAQRLLQESKLLQSVGSRGRRRPWVEDLVAHDVASLQATLANHGFFKAQVRAEKRFQQDATSTPPVPRVALDYVVQEGPQARLSEVSLQLEGPASLREAMLAVLRAKPCAPRVAEHIDADVQALQLVLSQRGYIDGEISVQELAAPAPPQASAALAHPEDVWTHLRFVVRPNRQARLAHVLLRGNFRTRAATVRQQAKLVDHGPLNLAQLGAAKRALRASNLFDAVQLTPHASALGDGNTFLVLALEEREVRAIDGVASFSSDNRFALGADYHDANLLGRAIQLNITARLADASETVPHLRIGNQDLFEARLRAPNPWGLPMVAEASALYRYRNPTPSYKERRLGAQAGLSQTFLTGQKCLLCPNLTVRLGYEISEAFLEDGDDDRPRPPQATIARVVPSISFDARDQITDPHRGYNVDVRLEGANPALAGLLQARATAFWRTLISGQIYLPLGPPLRFELTPKQNLGGPLILALAVNYGAAGPYGHRGGTPTSESFGFGGDMDVRGLKNRASSAILNYPDYLLTASGELRWYLLENLGFGSLQLAGFVDFGAVSAQLNTLGHGGTVSVGPALRYVTPVGPLSLAYGKALRLPRALRADPDDGAPRHGRIHFTFGYTF